MSTILETVEVAAPVPVVYEQWTRFEDFPEFMEGIEQVSRIDARHLHWVAEVAGVEREWDAEITEERPDERIAWRSTVGARNAHDVTFQRLDASATRVVLRLELDANGVIDASGDPLGRARRRAAEDLDRFRELLEERTHVLGSWAPVGR
jgi:uncharacterized membrane protein